MKKLRNYLLAASVLSLCGCATTTKKTSNYAAPEALNIRVSDCPNIQVDSAKESFDPFLGLAVEKGFDFLFSALKNAADPEKGKTTTTALTSFLASEGTYNSSCLLVTKGRTTTDPNLEIKNFNPGIVHWRSKINDLTPLRPRRAEADSQNSGTGVGGMAGPEIGSQNALPEIEESRSLSGSVDIEFNSQFNKAGLHFAEKPNFAGIFKFHKAGSNIRLIPIASYYGKKSRGALFRSDSSRDLLLTVNLSNPEANKKTSLGPIPLGRFSASNKIHQFASSIDNGQIITKWASLPDSLFSNEENPKPVNIEVTLTEVQAPNRVAGLVYEITKDAKEDLKSDFRSIVDKNYARSKKIKESEEQDTALAEFETKLSNACANLIQIKQMQDNATVVSTQSRMAVRNKQRIANRSAEKNALDIPFKALVPTTGQVPNNTWENICE